MDHSAIEAGAVLCTAFPTDPVIDFYSTGLRLPKVEGKMRECFYHNSHTRITWT